MSFPPLFSPDTLHEDLHKAYDWAVKQGAYSATNKVILKQMRTKQPDVYMDLASMAHEGKWKHGNSYMFHQGFRIFMVMDAKE